jgi:hypothetical protein
MPFRDLHPQGLYGDLEQCRAHLGLPVPRIAVQRRRHRHSWPGGQATADQESACETADSPRATIGLATAGKSEKWEIKVADRIRLGDHEVEFGRLRNPITGIAGGCARGERSRPPAAELLEQVRFGIESLGERCLGIRRRSHGYNGRCAGSCNQVEVKKPPLWIIGQVYDGCFRRTNLRSRE